MPLTGTHYWPGPYWENNPVHVYGSDAWANNQPPVHVLDALPQEDSQVSVTAALARSPWASLGTPVSQSWRDHCLPVDELDVHALGKCHLQAPTAGE